MNEKETPRCAVPDSVSGFTAGTGDDVQHFSVGVVARHGVGAQLV